MFYRAKTWANRIVKVKVCTIQKTMIPVLVKIQQRVINVHDIFHMLSFSSNSYSPNAVAIEL